MPLYDKLNKVKKSNIWEESMKKLSVKKGIECGITIENFNDIKEGDMIEAYIMEEVKRK